MKKLFLSLTLAAGFAAANLHAADAKGYQVTGPVVEVTPSVIVVMKDEKKWEIAKDKSTKGGEVKVGDKVTVYYSMTATEIEVKPAKAEKKADKAEKAEKKAEKK
ncbi:MAG: hypothetical protein RL616_294 [Verrucomicrobiota bacterium]|jgi:RNase P/RNase MRP subunit p29